MLITPIGFFAPSNNGPIEKAFVTGQTLSGLRNNGGGYYTGMQFQVGAKDMTVTALGRWQSGSDSASHGMRIYDATGNTVLASATVDMSQPADADGYVYVPCSVLLSAGTTYCIASVETDGVDHFYDAGTAVTTTTDGSALAAFYTSGIPGFPGSPGNCYGPVNFKYHL